MNKIKRFIAFLAVMCLLAFCAACAPHTSASSTEPPAGEITTPTDPDGGSEPDAPDDPNTPTDPTNPIEPTEPSGAGGVPVACFSYSGNTRTVAEYIARYSGGTAAEIVAKQPYTAADVNYNDQSSRCQTERRADARPEIADGTYAGIDPDKYSTVIVGYPIWNGEEPMIVRTFIEHYGELKDKVVYTFSTGASSSPSALNGAMKTRYGETNIAGNLHFASSTLSGAERRVREWLQDNGLLKADDTQTENIMYIKVNGTTLTAELADNSTARALAAELEKRDITIAMSDYGNFEKVGTLGVSLPRNDEYKRTEAGDLIWYQGRSFVIYYDTNAYTFTRVGKLKDVTGAQLRSILGDGDVTVTLSRNKL